MTSTSLRVTLRWISPAPRNGWCNGLIVRVEQLALFPSAGGKPHELAGTPYRQLVINPLRIFYWVTGEQVLVVHVMRGEQLFRLRVLRDHET